MGNKGEKTVLVLSDAVDAGSADKLREYFGTNVHTVRYPQDARWCINNSRDYAAVVVDPRNVAKSEGPKAILDLAYETMRKGVPVVAVGSDDYLRKQGLRKGDHFAAAVRRPNDIGRLSGRVRSLMK